MTFTYSHRDRTRRGHRAARRRRSGSATLELSISLLVLVYLCYGMIEFGYYFYVKNAYDGAAREGARAAIVAGAAYSDVTTAVSNAMNPTGISSYTVKMYINNAPPAPVGSGSGTAVTTLTGSVAGDTIYVVVQGTWGTVGSGFRPMGLIGSSKTIFGSSVMRKEG
jgi:Flp pilus assembly protein TadG